MKRTVAGRARPNEPLAEFCEVGVILLCTLIPTERHHKLRRSRGGSDDASNTLDVCRSCHAYVHSNPRESYERGWLTRGVA